MKMKMKTGLYEIEIEPFATNAAGRALGYPELQVVSMDAFYIMDPSDEEILVEWGPLDEPCSPDLVRDWLTESYKERQVLNYGLSI